MTTEFKVVPISDPQKERDREVLVAWCKEQLALAEAGDLVALFCITEGKINYTHHRLGLSREQAAGLLSRAMHNLNMEWDDA